MNEAPLPLISADVDLRDFAFMPLDVLRLRDSDLASVEDAEVFRCSVLSWCVSWHQVPAASLPDDDGLLARLLGFGRDVKGWRRIRAAGGMRGWIKCSDGRLYHPVVAEKAREAWLGKLAQRWRTEAARVKKHNQRHRLDGENAVQMPEFDEWMSLGCPWGHSLPVPRTTAPCPQPGPESVPRETPSKGQGEGQGQGQGQGQGDSSVSGERAKPDGSAKPPRGAKKCPDSFAMTDNLVQWAKENTPGISIAGETAKFRDHTFSRSITDWPGTWRNWMRKAFEDRKGIAKGGPPEPEWRREQRERNEAFLGPAAAKRSTAQPETLEIFDVAARRVG